MPETDDDVGPDVDGDSGDGWRIPFDVRNVFIEAILRRQNVFIESIMSRYKRCRHIEWVFGWANVTG